jgi:hypothetical protein
LKARSWQKFIRPTTGYLVGDVVAGSGQHARLAHRPQACVPELPLASGLIQLS